MFTPPPSPLPSSLGSFPIPNSPVPSPSPSPPLSPQQSLTPGPPPSSHPPKHGARARRLEMSMAIQDRKRRISWYTRLVVIIVPLVLVLAAFLRRFASRPLFLDLLVGPSPGARVLLATGTDRTGHSMHPLHRRQNGVSTMPSVIPSSMSSVSGLVFSTIASTPTSTQTQAPSQIVPTIPTSPPDLPTPFPQPLDTTLGSNFTTLTCETFFTNMTQSLAFRQCRSFSFLSQTSYAFLEAQLNITLLNIDIWGVCNTPVSADQCASNMDWFASALLDACSQEKRNDNQLVMQTLESLGLYSLMRQVACVEDQNTSTYCYIEAASNPDPSDLYIYSLPWTSLPNNTNMSCSDCNKNVMGLFGSQSNQVDGLKNTYNAAAKLASSKCGSTYVYTQSVIASSSALQWIGAHPPTSWTLALALCVLFIGLI